MSEKLRECRYSYYYLILTVLFCTCLIISNLTEIKTISIGWLTITGGVLVFPISYIINDCVTEVYGYQKAKLMILLGFFTSVFVTVVLQIVLVLPGSAEWTSQEAMEQIYGSVPRIMFASYVALLCGSLVNAYSMSVMKKHVMQHQHEEGKKYHFGLKFAARAILSTIYGESLDSVIFFPIAFGGTVSWGMIGSMIVTQAVLKTVYEILILPVTIQVVRKLHKVECR